MSNRRRRFARVEGIRAQRRVFLVATEGRRTEPDYFKMRMFRPPETAVHVKTLPSKTESSPASVLARMRKYLNEYGITDGDEAWLVIDRDHWKPEQLETLYKWCNSREYAGLAVSNPQFEFWLLLHFEDGVGAGSQAECLKRLEGHCGQYDKSNLPVHKFTRNNVRAAVGRAKKKDNPPCKKWPATTGTTVYRLVERILP